MYEKAKREFGRMKSSPNIDTVFNFYVTAYHVKDYAEVHSKELRAAINELFEKDQDFQLCDYICHKGKHLKLTHKKWTKHEYELKTRHEPGAVLGKWVLGKDRLGGYLLLAVADGVEMDVIELGQQLIEKWERFFKDNGI